VRVVVTGATGNVGTAVVEALGREPAVEEIVGIARRPAPDWSPPKTRLVAADISVDDLDDAFAGAAAVVHLAWLIQPSRDQGALWRTNVVGSERVIRAAAEQGVRAVVHASSVGAYSPGPRDRRVDESWPTNGIPTLPYSWQKAYVERVLDTFEAERPDVRVVRMRPALIFRHLAASGIRRQFLGFVPTGLVPAERATSMASNSPIALQAVHSDDVAAAYVSAVLGEARGAFNLAAEPVLGRDRHADLVHRVARAMAHVSWSAHLMPVDPGWIDLARRVPLLDSSRAARELQWQPTYSAVDAVHELLRGLQEGSGKPTPPLEPIDPMSVIPDRAGATGAGDEGHA
jgi:nucleoside-diphosphate-sugar epimerase